MKNTYDYYENVLADVKAAMKDYPREADETNSDYRDRLCDSLWIDDSVTGNGSGSYTFSSYKASENLVGNFDLASEAIEEFGIPEDPEKLLDPEFLDVSIRCYLLSGAIETALEDEQ